MFFFTAPFDIWGIHFYPFVLGALTLNSTEVALLLIIDDISSADFTKIYHDSKVKGEFVDLGG